MRALRYDCDADAVLALVEPAGPACHTGERTCFFTGRARADARRTRRCRRWSARSPRAARPTPGRSYTARLLADPGFIGEKVQEEAEEVARAAREESDERVAEEAADVLYHLEVLLASRGLALADAEACSTDGPPLMAVASDIASLTGVIARRSTRCARSPAPARTG